MFYMLSHNPSWLILYIILSEHVTLFAKTLRMQQKRGVSLPRPIAGQNQMKKALFWVVLDGYLVVIFETTLFPKRNATFLKLPFFLGNLGEIWAKCHFYNAPGTNPRFHSYTLFPKRNATLKNNGICISCNRIFFFFFLWKSWEDVYSAYWVYLDNHLIFFDGVFCLLLPEVFHLVNMNQGHWPWSRVILKNLDIKVAFLLGESVFKKCKNLGRLWLAYTELQGDFCMLQFISVDPRHFTQSGLSLGWSDLHKTKSVGFL